MPFVEVSVMDQREEFCRLGSREGVNIRELCQRYGISAPTGYMEAGEAGRLCGAVRRDSGGAECRRSC